LDIYNIRMALNNGKTIYDLPLRVTYYARVSTDKDEQLHSLSAQVRYYSEFIQRCPNWTFVEGYIDEGLSGTSVLKRENFQRMIENAKENCFDFIVTKEISRFSRNTLDSIQYTQELLRYGVGILFQSDNINTLMPDAELRLTIMASIAQDEVRKISERVKFGFKRAIENGVVLGNNRIWGYKKQEGKLVIDEEEAKIVQLIFDLYANQHLGIRAIARNLAECGYKNTLGNSFSFSTIRGILTNPKYKGYYCGGKSCKFDYKINERKYFSPEEWTMYKDEAHVPPIISEELWDKANRILNMRSEKQSTQNKSSYTNKYPYSGKIICGTHKQPYYRSLFRYKHGNKEVWQCQEYRRNGKKGCNAPTLYTHEIDEVMRQCLEDINLDKNKILQEMLHLYSLDIKQTKIEIDIARFQRTVDDIVQRKDKLLDLNIAGQISDHEFVARNDRFNQEIASIREKICAIESKKEQKETIASSMDELRQAIKKELSFSNGFSIGLIDSLLNQIEVHEVVDAVNIFLDVHLNVSDACHRYRIHRTRRGEPSICSEQYI